MLPLTEIFCLIDDFCKHFQDESSKIFLPCSKRKRKRKSALSLSEIITILVMFHLSHYRTFKDFYMNCILVYHRKDFPKLVSYNRFVELMPHAIMPLTMILLGLTGLKTGKYYVDSTKLPVCHNLRIARNKVFKDCAKRGKTSTGWFFGFKLHLVINDQGELMSFVLTSGNVDDRTPVLEMMKKLQGWLFGDRGYISSKLFEHLGEIGVELITRVKKNMKEKFIDPIKQQFLNQRGIIETIIDQLKNMLLIDHTRHRSVINMQVNVLSGLLAYVFKPKKVSVKFHELPTLQMSLTSN